MVFGKQVHVQTDIEGSGSTLLQYGAPLSFHLEKGLISRLSQNEKGSSFNLHIPSFACNSFEGSLQGIIDFARATNGFSLSSTADGTLTSGTTESPINFLVTLIQENNDLSFSTDLAIQPFFFTTMLKNGALGSSSHSTFRCHDLAILRQFLPLAVGGSGEISLGHTQSDAGKEIFLSSHFTNALLGPLSCKQADFSISGQNNLDQLHSSIDITSGKFSNVSLDSAHATLCINPQEQGLTISDLRLSGTASALPFNLSGNGEGKFNSQKSYLTINKLDGTLLNEKISLAHPASVEFYDFENMFSQTHFSAQVGDQGILNGYWIHPSPSRSTLELSWTNLPFPIMASLAGIEKSDGAVTGECHYTTEPHSSLGSFHMQANVTRCGPLGNSNGALDITSDLSLADEKIQGTLSLKGCGIIEPLQASISIPIERKPKTPFFIFALDKPIEGSVQGKIQISQLFYYWMPEEIGCEALLAFNTRIKGSLHDVQLEGPVFLKEGRMELLATGQVLENIEIEGDLDHRKLSIHSIKATDTREGSLSGKGFLSFPGPDPFTWQATLSCTNLNVVDLPYTSATADGVLKLQGTNKSLTISGNAVAREAFVDVAARFPANIPDLPVVFSDAVQEQAEPFVVLFDLYVKSQSGSKIQGRGLKTSWKGQAHLVGPATKLRVEGFADCTQGTFTLAGKELSITRGSISVNGNLFTDSRLNVLANVSLPSITVHVGLRGSLKDPKFIIQSSPALPEKEILSFLLFNKEYGDISPIESLQLANAAMTLEQSSGPFNLIDKVKTTLGIDLIDIGSSSPAAAQPPPWTALGADSEEMENPLATQQNDVTLKVGKYISHGVAVTVSKDVNAGVNRIGLEASVSQHITAQAEIGDDAGGIASLKWKKDY